MSGRFTVKFYNDDATKEYRKLDGSVKKLVNVGLKKLEMRADEIGKQLEGGGRATLHSPAAFALIKVHTLSNPHALPFQQPHALRAPAAETALVPLTA